MMRPSPISEAPEQALARSPATILLVERKLLRDRGHHHTQVAAIQALLPTHRIVLLAGEGYDGFLPYPARSIASSGAATERLLRRYKHGSFGQRVQAGTKLAVSGRLFSPPKSGFGDDLLASIAAFGMDGDDAIVVPSATLDDLAAVADICVRRARPPQCVLRFIDPYLGEPRQGLRDGRTMELLQALRGCVHLFCETEEMADDLAARYRYPVAGGFYLPCTVDPMRDWPRPPRSPGEPLRVGVFGLPRKDKGADRIPAIIAATSKIASTAIEFLVQGSESDFGASGAYAGLPATGGLTSVRRLVGPLAPEVFQRLFLSLDAVLLPYDVASYGLQGSGIVLDAVAACIPLILTRGLSMKRLHCHGNAVAAETDTEFAEAVVGLTMPGCSFVAGCAAAKAAFRQVLMQHPLASVLAPQG